MAIQMAYPMVASFTSALLVTVCAATVISSTNAYECSGCAHSTSGGCIQETSGLCLTTADGSCPPTFSTCTDADEPAAPLSAEEALEKHFAEFQALGGDVNSPGGKLIAQQIADARARRGQPTQPEISTADGSVIIDVLEGKHVGLRIGGADPIFLDNLPEEVKSYSDDALKQFALGFQIATANNKGVPELLDYVNETLNEKFDTVVEDAEAAYAKANTLCDAKLAEHEERIATIEAFSFTTSTTATTTTQTTSTTTQPFDGTTKDRAMDTCKAILTQFSNAANGEYWISPVSGRTADAFKVYCDMSNGGWAWAFKNVPFKLPYKESHTPTEFVTSKQDKTEYKFTLYGAAAGDSYYYPSRAKGGKGGRVVGSRTFAASTKLYIFVGQRGGKGHKADQNGDPSKYNYAGWNGGGRGTRGGSGGGGCTDIRTSKSNLQSRILVAAGGGGCGNDACNQRGGDGGGTTGQSASDNQAYGGTQNAGGKNNCGNGGCSGRFGKGGNFCNANDSGGGGCGWWGGSASCSSNRPGAGGSSYFGGMSGDKATSSGVNSNDGYGEYIFK